MASSPTRQRSAHAIRQMREDKIPDLLNDLVAHLAKEKPKDPLESLIGLLESMSDAERAEYCASPISSKSAGDGGGALTSNMQNVPPSPIGTPRGVKVPQAAGSPYAMLTQGHRRVPNQNGGGGHGEAKVSTLTWSSEGAAADDMREAEEDRKARAAARRSTASSPTPEAPPSGLRRDRTLIGATQSLGQDARRIIGMIERDTTRQMSEWGLPSLHSGAQGDGSNSSSSSGSAFFFATSGGASGGGGGAPVAGRLLRSSDASTVHGVAVHADATNGDLLIALALESQRLLMKSLSDVSARNEDVSTAMVVTGKSGGIGLLGGVMATAAAAALASLAERQQEKENKNVTFGPSHGGGDGGVVSRGKKSIFDDIVGAGLDGGGGAIAAESDEEEDHGGSNSSDYANDRSEGAARGNAKKRSGNTRKNRPVTMDAHSHTIRSTNTSSASPLHAQPLSAAAKSINKTLTSGGHGNINAGAFGLGSGVGASAVSRATPTVAYLLNNSTEDATTTGSSDAYGVAGGGIGGVGLSPRGNIFGFGFGGDSPYRSPRSARGGVGANNSYNNIAGGGGPLFADGYGAQQCEQIEEILHSIRSEEKALSSLLLLGLGGGGGMKDDASNTIMAQSLVEECHASMLAALSTVERNARLLR